VLKARQRWGSFGAAAQQLSPAERTTLRAARLILEKLSWA
jgi:hypothetical protein